MAQLMSVQRKKIHPHKFTMWIALGSIIMMFAGLTSAYIVKRDLPGWAPVELPKVFWYSTGVILLSSLTMQMALKAFKERAMSQYRILITATAVLGIGFIALQAVGYLSFESHGIHLTGRGSNASHSFLLAIGGLHAVHVLGGVIALLVMFFRAFSMTSRNYSAVPVEIVSTYWHFVDILWIYLFVFFNWMQ
jgi:cytochrome c oxidase subunit 3